MPQGNSGHRKTVHKATHWWKHGKHKGQIEASVSTNREIEQQEKRRKNLKEMKSSVKELFESRKQK